MIRILIADDDISIVDTIAGILKSEGGFEVETALNHEDILTKIEQFKPQLMTLDLKFGARTEAGIAILKEIRKRFDHQQLPIIIISGTGDTVKLQELFKSGMNDYIFKPVDAEELLEKIHGNLPSAPAGTEAAWKKQVIGNSKAMMDLMLQVGRLARSEVDTLILGEHGTGKDLIAEIYHALSPRKNERFYSIDCTSIPESLMETELWGSLAGAHSQAMRPKKGRIEMAYKGILLLNEIGDLPSAHQSKLLNFIQDKTFIPVGGVEPQSLDVVILAATNKNLPELIKQGKFREDLYFRLHSNNVVMPPLRDRRGDIPLLVEHFIKKYNKSLKKDVKAAAPEVLNKFLDLPWPGNVRQLEKCIETGMTNCRGKEIAWKDVRPYLEQESEDGCEEGLDLSWSYKQVKDYIKCQSEETERAYIKHQLVTHNYKIVKTAEAIGLKNYQQLNEIMKRLKISK